MTSAPALNGKFAIAAPAKVNLTLQVRGRRPDGYHLLDSLVVFAGVGDRLSVAPGSDLRLSVCGPFAGALAQETDNLVLRAARFLADETGVTAGANVLLEKNLPVASGIGGGSSDAAAALRACGKLWGVDPFRINDALISSAIGADVPVCLRRQPSFVSGAGEVIARAPKLPEAWLVLVNPRQPLATKHVFAALAGRYSQPGRPVVDGLKDARALAQALQPFGNDLTAPALELMPAIAEILEALAEFSECLLTRLSGSGPTCFGLFANARAAEIAATAIGAKHPSWWVAHAPMLPSDPDETCVPLGKLATLVS